jgi:hypothetical protein
MYIYANIVDHIRPPELPVIRPAGLPDNINVNINVDNINVNVDNVVGGEEIVV